MQTAAPIVLGTAALGTALLLAAPASRGEEPPPAGTEDVEPGETGGAGVEDELEKLIEEAAKQSTLGGWADPKTEREPTYPWLEHHGYFRFRADVFVNGHLGTVVPGDAISGTSAIPAPLTENQVNNLETTPFFDDVKSRGADTLAGANVRLRYSPALHLSRSMRIRATFDVLDNLVLGSTPDFDGNLSRPDVPLVAFTGSQAPPESGSTAFRDGVRVKEAYADWQPAFLLRVGRMSSHWGLGVLANGGTALDSDYGDYVDRALLLLKMYGVYVAPMWDFVSTGATTSDPGEFFGQPKDLGQADDVKEWVLAIFQRPVSQADRDRREVSLREELRPAFDWGLYTVYRTQDLDLETGSYAAYVEDGGEKTYDGLQLVPRKATAIVPDLWLRYEKRFDYTSGIRIELEAVGIFGKIENVKDENEGTRDRTIEQYGAALELEYERGQLGFGLRTGFASGDSAEGFGVNDRHTISEPDGTPNEEVTAFKFDRDYHLDLLLFREVIGTVTNAFYARPHFRYDLFDSVEDSLGLELSFLYGQALEEEATPGDDPFLGAEVDLRLFYQELGRFDLDIEGGLLFPGSAFDYYDAAGTRVREASLAWTVQTRLGFSF